MGRSQKSCCHGSLCHVLESSLKAKDVRVALKQLAQNLQFFAVLWLWYLFIGWETNWMAFNIIKVDRHSMPEFTALLDPNWSTTQRLFHKSWKSWKWSKRMLPVSQPRAHLLFPEKMKRHLISISGSVALFTFSPFTPANIWQLCCQKNQLLRSQDRPARLGSGYCNFASSRPKMPASSQNSWHNMA